MLNAKAMRLGCVIVCLAGSVAMLSAPLAAQGIAPPTIPPGTRIRVRLNTSPTKMLVGTVVMLRNDSLAWLPQGSLGVPLSAISTLEVSRGKHSNAGKGALIGGATLGFLSLIASAAAQSLGESLRVETSPGQVPLLTAAGAVLGAGVGAFIGSLFRSDNWQTVPIRTEPVSLGQFGVTVSLRF